ILAAIRAKSEDTVEKIEKKNRTIQLKNEGGIWKVWKFTSSEEEMAEALVKADSKAGRAGVLAEEKKLLTVELGQALLTHGHQLSRQGSYSRAVEIYELAMDLAEQLGDKKLMASTLRGFGNIHQSRGNYTEALEQYQKSLKISEEIGDKGGIASTLNNIGGVH